MVSPIAQIEPLIRFAREKDSWGNPTLFVEVCRLISAVQGRLTPRVARSILEFLEMAAPRVSGEALEKGAEVLARHQTLPSAIKDWCLSKAPEPMLIVLIRGQLDLEKDDFSKIGDRGTDAIFDAFGARDSLPASVLNCLSARLKGDGMRVFLEKHGDKLPAEACGILRHRADFVPEIKLDLLPH